MVNEIQAYDRLESQLNALARNWHKGQIDLKLERIVRLLDCLDHPEKDIWIIQVGGTSGKGSTTHLIQHMLCQSACQVGAFFSPYVQRINEICLLNGKQAKSVELLAAFEQVAQYFDLIEQELGMPPSYFETKLAMTLLIWQKHSVDIGLLEVGMGGRLDATNAIHADIAVLTNIGLDHTEFLGETITDICKEKAGIVKPHQQVISSVTQKDCQKIIRETVSTMVDTKLWQIGDECEIKATAASTYEVHLSKDVGSPKNTLSFECTELHQAYNATCAWLAVSALGNKVPIDLNQISVQKAIDAFQLIGRFEWMPEHPKYNLPTCLDGAHNLDKLSALFQQWSAHYDFAGTTLVLALKKGKESQKELFELICAQGFSRIIATEFKCKGIWQSVDAQTLANSLTQHLNKSISHYADPRAAMDAAQNPGQQGKKQAILASGSFFLIGDLREIWYPSGHNS
jgi:dihydrofolate synthase/folylpolyglutamate synthase